MNIPMTPETYPHHYMDDSKGNQVEKPKLTVESLKNTAQNVSNTADELLPKISLANPQSIQRNESKWVEGKIPQLIDDYNPRNSESRNRQSISQERAPQSSNNPLTQPIARHPPPSTGANGEIELSDLSNVKANDSVDNNITEQKLPEQQGELNNHKVSKFDKLVSFVTSDSFKSTLKTVAIVVLFVASALFFAAALTGYGAPLAIPGAFCFVAALALLMGPAAFESEASEANNVAKQKHQLLEKMVDCNKEMGPKREQIQEIKNQLAEPDLSDAEKATLNEDLAKLEKEVTTLQEKHDKYETKHNRLEKGYPSEANSSADTSKPENVSKKQDVEDKNEVSGNTLTINTTKLKSDINTLEEQKNKYSDGKLKDPSETNVTPFKDLNTQLNQKKTELADALNKEIKQLKIDLSKKQGPDIKINNLINEKTSEIRQLQISVLKNDISNLTNSFEKQGEYSDAKEGNLKNTPKFAKDLIINTFENDLKLSFKKENELNNLIKEEISYLSQNVIKFEENMPVFDFDVTEDSEKMKELKSLKDQSDQNLNFLNEINSKHKIIPQEAMKNEAKLIFEEINLEKYNEGDSNELVKVAEAFESIGQVYSDLFPKTEQFTKAIFTAKNIKNKHIEITKSDILQILNCIIELKDSQAHPTNPIIPEVLVESKAAKGIKGNFLSDVNQVDQSGPNDQQKIIEIKKSINSEFNRLKEKLGVDNQGELNRSSEDLKKLTANDISIMSSNFLKLDIEFLNSSKIRLSNGTKEEIRVAKEELGRKEFTQVAVRMFSELQIDLIHYKDDGKLITKDDLKKVAVAYSKKIIDDYEKMGKAKASEKHEFLANSLKKIATDWKDVTPSIRSQFDAYVTYEAAMSSSKSVIDSKTVDQECKKMFAGIKVISELLNA